MSDLYDSLEDECDERKCTCGSPEEYETPKYILETPENESPKKYSFYLRESPSEDENDSSMRNESLNDGQKKKPFLPKLYFDIKSKGLESVRNTILQNQILNEQGLQLNKDGSITKSPRWDKEELPFITREYRNLQFQKKKTYADFKKASSANVQKKTILKDMDKPGDETGVKRFNPPRRKRASFERLNSLSFNSNQLKVNKDYASSYNMTDSMKEKLLQTQKESPRKSIMTVKNVGKTNCETVSYETSNVTSHNEITNEKSVGQEKNAHFTHRLQKNHSCLGSNQKQFKSSNPKIHGYLSDISLTTLRPKLNYSERHKLENGYNIYRLKQLNKKVESDTNRSNFGDSVVEELPEVFSVPNSCNASAREDEETFYQKLIEKDKCLKQHSHYSARSEGPVHVGKFRSVLQERKNFFRSRDITKTKDIDLDIEVDNLVNSFKKSSHYCPHNSSTNATKDSSKQPHIGVNFSKELNLKLSPMAGTRQKPSLVPRLFPLAKPNDQIVELALKGKTYGYLANARNIFRLKALSEKKIAAEKDEGSQAIEDVSPIAKKVSDISRGSSTLSKHNSSLIGIFPNVKGGQPRYLEKSPRRRNTYNKSKLREVPCEIQKKLVLPQVCSQKVSISKVQNRY